MSYITTFDAAFYTAIALYVLALLVHRIPGFTEKMVKLASSHTKTFLAVSYTVSIAQAVVFFWWSTKGTTTCMFWGFLAGMAYLAVSYKLQQRRQSKMSEEEILDAIVRPLN